MPLFSYWASAFGHLLSSLIMLVISTLLGNKYYKIPYNWGKISLLFVLLALFFGLGMATSNLSFLPQMGINTLLLCAFCGSSYMLLRKA